MTKKQITNYLILLSSISKGKKISVILAEDDIDDQILFEEAVTESEVPVLLKVLGDGEKLMCYLRNLSDTKPDVIFLDLNMPCLNGFECLDLIRNNEKLKEIPVVIFSTSVSKTDILNTYNKGANLYFPKPYSFQQLVESLTKLFKMEKEEIQQRRGIETFLFEYK